MKKRTFTFIYYFLFVISLQRYNTLLCMSLPLVWLTGKQRYESRQTQITQRLRVLFKGTMAATIRLILNRRKEQKKCPVRHVETFQLDVYKNKSLTSKHHSGKRNRNRGKVEKVHFCELKILWTCWHTLGHIVCTTCAPDEECRCTCYTKHIHLSLCKQKINAVHITA